jgi:hypothetical protein
VLTDVAPEKLPTRLIAFQGVTDTSFVDVAGQADPRPPRHQQLLTVVDHRALRVQHQAVIRIGNDAGFRIDLGDGLVHAMQADQR